jgi:S1-C subfamily serine protease
MNRILAVLCLAPAMMLAAVSFQVEGKDINRAVPGAGAADMLARVMPAVVSIRTAATIPPEYLGRLRARVAPEDLKSKTKTDPKTGEVQMFVGLGSGTIVHPDGYVISNRHVVMMPDNTVAKLAYVTLSDRREFKARVVAVDDKTDIAILKVEEHNLPFARFADSDKARVGDPVYAIGNPLGVGMSVSSGIVSALGRSGMGLNYEDFIQTDAAINHGNSGGPLVDFEGRILGMNTMIRTDGRGEGNIGIGFSIPSNLMVSVAQDLANSGKVVRGFVGLFGEDLTAEEAAKVTQSRNGAVRITEVSPDSPAARGGLRKDDIIVALNSKPFENWNDLRLAIAKRRPGETILMSVIRKGQGTLARITVAERPAGS